MGVKPVKTWISICIVILFISSIFTPIGQISANKPKDSDYDRWSDEYEKAMGTDPNNPDTDGDGILDSDDPTPKGSLVSEDELWETFVMDLKTSPVVTTVENNVTITVDVETFEPDGTRLPLDSRVVYLYVYFDYYFVEKLSANATNGVTSFQYQTTTPGMLQFVGIVNDTDIPIGTTFSHWEINKMKREKKCAYNNTAVYPDLYITLSPKYYTLLPGHTDSFESYLWSFNPQNTTEEFLSRFKNSYHPLYHLEELYQKTEGTIYVTINKDSTTVYSTTFSIPSTGLTWNYKFDNIGTYWVIVYAYENYMNWDNNLKNKYPQASIYIRIIDPTFTWFDGVSSTRLFNTESSSINKVSLNVGQLNESYFNELYHQFGLSGIAKNYPSLVTQEAISGWVGIFYTKSGHAYELTQQYVSGIGSAVLQWTFDVPDTYIVGYSLGDSEPYHPPGKFIIYNYDSYNMYQHYTSLRYITVSTDNVINIFPLKTCFFSTEAIQTTITFVNSSTHVTGIPVMLYKDEYSIDEVTPNSTFTSYNWGMFPSKNKYDLKAIPKLSTRVESMVDIFGVNVFGGNWVGQVNIKVVNLAIYTDLPSQLVYGLKTSFRVIVYDNSGASSNISVDIDLCEYRGSYCYDRTNVFSGKTNDAGSVLVDFLAKLEYSKTNTIEIEARKNDGTSEILKSYFNGNNQRPKGMITTNKPLYKPGDIIYVRLFVCDPYTQDAYNDDVVVKFRDPYSREIYRTELTINEYGVNGTEIPLGREIPWGEYSISLETTNGYHIASRYIEVKYYDLPEVHLDFITELQSVKAGDTIDIPAYVEYLFGAPVTEGIVEFKITGMKKEIHEYPWYYKNYYGLDVDYGYGMDSYWSPYYQTIETVFTISETIEVTNGWANITLIIPDNITMLKINAQFTDRFEHIAKNEHILYVGAAPDTSVKYILGLSTDKTEYSPGETVNTEITLIKVIPVEDIITGIPDSKVNVMIEVTNTTGASKIVYSGNLYTDPSGKIETTLSSLGVNIASLMKSGYYSYIIVVNSLDLNITVDGNHTVFIVNRLRYEVSSIQTDYDAGDNAKIEIGVYDLLYNEYITTGYSLKIYRDDWYFGYAKDIYINQGTMTKSELIITWKIPDVMPCGKYIVEVDFDTKSIDGYELDFSANIGIVQLPLQIVSGVPNKLTLTTSKSSFVPGDKLILTTTLEDKFTGWLYTDIILEGELTTYQHSLVNEAVATLLITAQSWRYPIIAESYIIDSEGRLIHDKISIGPDLSKLRIEIITNKTEYKPGDYANIKINVYDQYDNLVKPSILGISIVDNAVFELKPDYDEGSWIESFENPIVLDRRFNLQTNWQASSWAPAVLSNKAYTFYPGVPYYTEPAHGADETNATDKDGGGDVAEFDFGGGPSADNEFDEAVPGAAELDQLEDEMAKTHLRKLFTDTAYWDFGAIASTGNYNLNIILPDNLANWRIKVTATTLDILGKVEYAYFNTSMDFFIKPIIPHIITQDDEVNFITRVYNFVSKSLDVTVGISAGDWLKIFGKAEKNITIDANTVEEVTFKVKIDGVYYQNLTIVASDFSTYRDAVYEEVKIRPNGALKTIHYAGVVEDNVSHTIEYYQEKVNSSEKVVLRVVPGYKGLLQAIGGSLSSYPYSCTEQTISRLLPNVLYWENSKYSGYRMSIWYKNKLYRTIVMDMQRLYYYQHLDGGWGWWKTDSSEPWMTAYSLYGLTRANKAGFFINSDAISNAQNYLIGIIATDGSWAGTRWLEGKDEVMTSYVLYSLVYSGYTGDLSKPFTYLNTKWSNSFTDYYGVTYYAMALETAGKEYKSQLDWLVSHKTGSHWPGGSSLGGSDETTSYIIYILAKHGGYKTDVRGALEWLTAQRLPNGRFGTTSDSIAAMIAIVEVLKTTEPINKNVRIYVNDDKIHDLHVDDNNFDEFYSRVDAQDLTGLITADKNTVKIEEEGTGDLFYELTIIQYLKVDVNVDYPQALEAKSNEIFTFQVVVDPVDSNIVKIMDLELNFPQTDELKIISTNVNVPKNSNDQHIINVTAMGLSPGIINLNPLTIAYQLDAGERDSGVVRKYFGPIEINITGDINNGLTRNNEETFESTIEKVIENKVIKINEPMNITLHIFIRSTLIGKNIQIIDYFPECFEVIDSAQGVVENGRIYWNKSLSTNGIDITYIIQPREKFVGEIGRATALYDNQVIGISPSPECSITDQDLLILREHSTTIFEPNEVVTVTLTIRNPGTAKSYLCVEDFIPPEFEVDERSVENNMWNNLEIQSYDISDEAVTFFVDQLKENSEIELKYNILTSTMGEFTVPSAKIYPMYTPESTSYSGADLLIGQPREPVATDPPQQGAGTDIAVYESGIIFSNDNPTHGDIVFINVTVWNHGKLNTTDFLISVYIDYKLHEIKNISINAGHTKVVAFEWVAVYGNHFIVVELDPERVLPEAILTNNFAGRNIFVRPPITLWIDISVTIEASNTNPMVGETVNITAELTNDGNMDTPEFLVNFYDNGEPFFDKTTMVKRESGAKIVVFWVAIGGTHNITVIVDRENITGDLNFESNKAFITIITQKTTGDEDLIEDDDEGKADWDLLTGSGLIIILIIILCIIASILVIQRSSRVQKKEGKSEEKDDEDLDVDSLLNLLEKEHKNKSIPDDIYKDMKERLEFNR